MTTCGLCQATLYDEWWLLLHILTTHGHHDVLLGKDLAKRMLQFTWPEPKVRNA